MKSGKNFPDNIYPGERCAHENHINNWEVIAQCANSTEGSNLLKQNGELTKAFQPELQSVPTVTFNHVSIYVKTVLLYFSAFIANG